MKRVAWLAAAGLLASATCFGQSGEPAPPAEPAPEAEPASNAEAPAGEGVSEAVPETIAVDADAVVPAVADAPAQLDDIEVTARKHRESLQDVPMSISAFNAEELTKRGKSDLRDIAKMATNVEMEASDPGHTWTYIRGIGTRRYDPGVDQSVATFVDGVYRGRSHSMNADLLAVDRVEVLKGPQGSLYGKNTIGGAISVTTAPPRTDAWGGTASWEPGFSSVSGDTFSNYALLATGPLRDDEIGLALALTHRDRVGYQVVLDGDPPSAQPRPDVRAGLENTWAGKAKLQWHIGDALDLTVAAGTSMIDGPPGIFSTNAHGDPTAVLYLQSPRVQRPQFTEDPRVVASSVPDMHITSDITHLSSNLAWRGAGVGVTSITGFQTSEYHDKNDTDGTGLDIVSNTVRDDADELTQELRVDFEWETMRLLLGAFYSREQTDRFERLHGGLDSLLADINSAQPVDIDFGTGLNAQSEAVFGQFNWQVLQDLELTLGLRYSRDQKTVHLTSSNDAVAPPSVFDSVAETYDFVDGRGWTSLDPLVSLKYDVRADTMIYATYSTGYKSGGFQWFALSEQNAHRLFDPEKVDNLELGAKATVLNRRLRVNASVFRMAYDNLQVLTIDSSGSIPVAVSQNAAKSTIQGAEVEGICLLTDTLTLDARTAYLRAVYDDYLQDPEDPSTQRAGNRLARSPENTAAAGLTWFHTILDGTLQARIGYSWKSSYFWEPDNDTPARGETEPSMGLVEASIGYDWKAWAFNLWGQNLTDEVYRVQVVDFGVQDMAGRNLVYYDIFGPPRSIGLKMSYAFGGAW